MKRGEYETAKGLQGFSFNRNAWGELPKNNNSMNFDKKKTMKKGLIHFIKKMSARDKISKTKYI